MNPRILFAACLAGAFGVIAQAEPTENILEQLNAQGYPHVKTVPFSATKKGHSLTALYKNEADKQPLLYFAEFTEKKDGADVSFRAYRPCTPTDMSGPLPQQIINVDGQKIEAYYACVAAPGAPVTQEVFMIKSVEGNEFVKNISPGTPTSAFS